MELRDRARAPSPRDRASLAMAATDRRNPNLDDFVGLNWSCWVDKVNVLTSDDNSKYGRKNSETMALSKEADMHIYGHCPAQDDIYLVVCSLCRRVIKPQAFEKHCDRWHDPRSTRCSQSSNLAHQQGPRPGPSLWNLSSSKETTRNGRCHEASSPHTTLPVHQRRTAETRKENSGHEGVNEKTMLHTTVRQSRARTYSRMHKNTDKSKCDLNGLCRVLDPEKKRKPCSQEPISNSPVWRMKMIDPPVRQKTALEEQNMERHLVKAKVKSQYLEEKSTSGASKHNSCHHSARCRDSPQSYPEDEGNSTVEVEVQLPYPFNQSLLSCGEGEDDNEHEVPDLSWHPKPLGLCTFGCRTLGCNIFTFDRRWQHLRLALSAMLEQHVNTHL
ncbi:ataxin-7-like protein 2b isoform X3 [Takifugu rubripes]|uniref:ataxin-7-like protein 2b isoform X3 n=1 Tax=Takifugu rubripes TaxID=31033 RepID=UPI0011457A5F|nr:ataxin-7-like isoform X3 [Takifugu rubripes]